MGLSATSDVSNDDIEMAKPSFSRQDTVSMGEVFEPSSHTNDMLRIESGALSSKPCQKILTINKESWVLNKKAR